MCPVVITGDSSGTLTKNSYAFCCPSGTDGSAYDGDGVTPIQSALAIKEYVPNADTMKIDDVGHFCWSDVFGGETVAPGELRDNVGIYFYFPRNTKSTLRLFLVSELTEWHREGRPWYGDEQVIEKWASWL
jgi:hypothetical protein